VIALDVKPVTKAEMLEKYILKEILPQYKPDTKIPSELVMAKELNTSRTTVHKIFSNLTAKGILYRENGLGTFVSKPKVKTPKTKIITAVCCSDKWHDPSLDESWFNTQFLLEGFSSAMQNNDYLLNILYIHPDEQSLEEGMLIMLKTQADAFIFPGLGGYGKYITKLTEQGKPCVVRALYPYYNSHCVYGLLADAFYDAMNYLIESGRKKIAFLTTTCSFSDYKLSGVFRAMEAHNIDKDNLLRIYTNRGFELDSYRAVAKYLAENKDFDAILSVTDRLAFGAFEAIKDAGLRIPEDIAIIGSDDLAECKKMDPPIASITSDFHKMGGIMFDIIDKALNNPDMELICKPTKRTFVPRESCGFINNKT
jgi:DNA-binding LacI/PurR family transcriptional regulator